MRRVLFYRLYDVDPTRLAELEDEARAFTRSRGWRGDAFWLADENTTDLFAMEYFRHLRNEEGPSLSAAGFLRLLGRNVFYRIGAHMFALRPPSTAMIWPVM